MIIFVDFFHFRLPSPGPWDDRPCNEDFWRDDLQAIVAHVLAHPDQALTVLGPLIKQGNTMKSEGWCYRHKKKCKVQTAFRHIAGTVCVGFSRRGAGLSVADITMICTLAWLAQRRSLQETEITQENVKGCPPELFFEFLGDLYWMDVVPVDAVCFGWACGRERQYLKFRHRVKVMSMVSPCSVFLKRFYRACKYSWTEHFWSHHCQGSGTTILEDELAVELKWALSRPSSSAHGQDLDVEGSTSFELALTTTEQEIWCAVSKV